MMRTPLFILPFAAGLLIWAIAKPLIGILCLVLGLMLVWAAVTGRFGRIPMLERLVGQGIRPKVRRKQFLTRVEQETLRHLEYALTWYGLALALIGVYFVFQRPGRKPGGDLLSGRPASLR